MIIASQGSSRGLVWREWTKVQVVQWNSIFKEFLVFSVQFLAIKLSPLLSTFDRD